MIKPNYVDPYSVYTRESAVKALGISQASFSKYFALNANSRVLYRGSYLNQRIDQILGIKRNYVAELDANKSVVKSAGTSIQVNNNYQTLSDSDIYYLSKKTDGGYLASNEVTNLVIKDEKQGGSYCRYVMPLVKTWLNSKVHPNVVLVDINDDATSDYITGKYKVLSNFTYYAECNMYAVGDTYDLMTDDANLFAESHGASRNLMDESYDAPSLVWFPVCKAHGDGACQNAYNSFNSQGVIGLLSMILNLNLKRSTKIVINDITTDVMHDDDFVKAMEKLFSISLGMNIETVLITDKNISDIIKNNAHIIDNIKDFPMDQDILTLTHR